jgi:hypothetical protein
MVHLPDMAEDLALDSVADRLRTFDPDGSGTARVLRETFDQIYNGQRTGRYSIKNPAKTEHAHTLAPSSRSIRLLWTREHTGLGVTLPDFSYESRIVH